MGQPGPSQDISVIHRTHFLENENCIIPNASIIFGGINKTERTHIERLVFKNKKRIWWEDDDIAAAVTLRLISRKAYLLFAEECWSTITWIINYSQMDSQPECLPGIQKE
ncbi:hypothetical protein PR048_010042 [Dryococelus australis]|uniref:Uncharacterized protein n=1 Tax=Dryococelus australis TaxID=614101 RepID=A0ABQ9I1L8_9NEOP|nr:hypothetical protein PR048_010042 [Dryococelus australis]